MDGKNRELIIRTLEIRHKSFHLSKNLRIIYVLKGELTLKFVAGKTTIKEGSIEIININEPVCFFAGTEGNVVLLFEIDGAFAKKMQPMIDRALYNCNTTLFYPCRTQNKYQEQLKSKLLLVYNLYTYTEDYSFIKKVLQEIEDLIVDKFHDLKNMLVQTDVSDTNLNRFLRIYDAIYSNSGGKINLKEIAEKEYVSVQYLSKEFNEKLNMNFKATVEYYKVIQAVRYLITTNMPVTLVSENSGFSAPRYFYKQFSYYLDCTPMLFRAKTRGEDDRVWEVPSDNERIKELVKKVMDSGMDIFSGSDKNIAEVESVRMNIGNKSDMMPQKEKAEADIIREIFRDVEKIRGIHPTAKFILLSEDEETKLKRFLGQEGVKPATMLISVSGSNKTYGELAYDIESVLSYMNLLISIASGKGVRTSFNWEISGMSESVNSILGYEPTDVIVGLLSFTFN